MNLKILQAYCTKRNYEFQSAGNGEEAFAEYVKACDAGLAPNICLLDLQMPVCDGITCAKLMRAYEHESGLPRCPIIMGKPTPKGKDCCNLEGSVADIFISSLRFASSHSAER